MLKEKRLELHFNARTLEDAVKIDAVCRPDIVEIFAKERCKTDLEALHTMVGEKWKVNGKVQ